MVGFERKVKPPRSQNAKSVQLLTIIQKGRSLPIVWFIMLGIAVFFYFFGWFVLIWVFAAAVLAVFIFYVFSLLRNKKVPHGSSVFRFRDLMQAHGFEGLDNSGRHCLACHEKVLRVSPGKTSEAEIRAFASRSPVWSENSAAVDGWMHPGIYCPNGCVTIFIDYPMATQKVDPDIYDIRLVDAGRNRMSVISYLRHVLDVSQSHLKNRFSRSPTVVASGRHHEVDRIYQELIQLGARVDLAKKNNETPEGT